MNIITMKIAYIRPYDGRDSRPHTPKTKGCHIVTPPSRNCARNFWLRSFQRFDVKVPRRTRDGVTTPRPERRGCLINTPLGTHGAG